MGSKGGEQAASPEAVPGFEQFGPLMQQALQGALGFNFGGPTQASLTPGEQQLVGNTKGVDFGGAANNLTNFLGPDMLNDVAAALQPALLDQPFETGAAALREQSALSGNLSSSGTVDKIGDLFADLTATFQGAVPGAAAQLGNAAAGIGNSLFGQALPGIAGVQGLQRQQDQAGIQNDINLAQFGAQLPGQVSGQLGGLGSIPLFQPTFAPGKMDSLMGAVLPAAGMAFGGPVGAKAGSAVANKGGGGGGGGKKGGGNPNIGPQPGTGPF